MAVYGYFQEPFERPYLTARIAPDGNSGVVAEIQMLVDTGADFTVLGPADVARLGLTFHQLPQAGTVRGIGGQTKTFECPIALALADQDEDRTHVFFLTAMAIESTTGTEWTPSLLGRDVLRRALLYCDGPGRYLSLAVVDSDAILHQ